MSFHIHFYIHCLTIKKVTGKSPKSKLFNIHISFFYDTTVRIDPWPPSIFSSNLLCRWLLFSSFQDLSGVFVHRGFPSHFRSSLGSCTLHSSINDLVWNPFFLHPRQMPSPLNKSAILRQDCRYYISGIVVRAVDQS